MQPISYPDGFPIKPNEAINSSYFLSPEEKQEWTNWLENASVEQQNELVETLHAMWVENQKEVIPEGFNLASDSAKVQNTEVIPTIVSPSVAPTEQVTSQPAQSLNSVQITEPVAINIPEETATPEILKPEIKTEVLIPNNSIDVGSENKPSKPALAQPEIPLINPVPEVASFAKPSDNQPKPKNNNINQQAVQSNNQNSQPDFDANAKQFGQSKYAPNPVLENKTPSSDEFTFQNNAPKGRNQNQRRSQDRQDFSETKLNTDAESSDNTGRNNPGQSNQAKKNPFSFTKLREIAARTSLEKLYQDFQESREKSYVSQKEYQDNYGSFLAKVMDLMIGIEGVADYVEGMTAKLLEMNDQNISLAERLNKKEEESRIAIRDLTLQVEDSRRDLDRFYRIQKELESNMRQNSNNSGKSSVDVFGNGEANEKKLELLMAKVSKLEQLLSDPNSKDTSKDNSRDKLNSLQKMDSTNSSSEENKTNKPEENGSAKRKIDIRNLF